VDLEVEGGWGVGVGLVEVGERVQVQVNDKL